MKRIHPDERKDLIKHLLSLEPRLTAKQVAKLAYPTEKTILINGKPYPSTYQAARNMLMRMVKRKELKRQEFDVGQADWFMLPTTRAVNKSHAHEVAAADLFVQYYGIFETWRYEPKAGQLYGDRKMKIYGKHIYFEVDRCHQNASVIREKIEAYIRYYYELEKQYGDRARFHVIFDIAHPNPDKVSARIKEIGEILDEFNRGNQFALSSHTMLTTSPVEDEIIYSPHGAFSLETL
jgi:hypothetical protein